MGRAALSVISGPASGQSVEVDREIVVGREGADLTIDDREMSRRHTAVRPLNGGVEVEDLGSMNGTFLDGRQIEGVEQITATAILEVGNSRIRVEFAPPPAGAPDVTRARATPIVEQPQTTRVSAAPDQVGPSAREGPPPTVARTAPPPDLALHAEEGWESERNLAKVGLVTMILTVITGVPGIFHPQPEPGDDNPRAFLDTIVPSDTWALLHLIIVLSYILSVPYFFALYRSLNRGAGALWARVGYASAIVAAAAAAVWMMLDGFAMKEIADDWAAATGTEKIAAEQAAFAMEHAILALFSLNVVLFAGTTIGLFALAIARDGRWPRPIGIAGIAIGAAGFVIGVIQLFTERTALVTHALVPLIFAMLTIWLVTVTVLWWRRVQAT